MIAQECTVLLHFLLPAFAIIEAERGSKCRLSIIQDTQKQFSVVMSRFEAQKQPLRSVYICGMEPIRIIFSYLQMMNRAAMDYPSPPKPSMFHVEHSFFSDST